MKKIAVLLVAGLLLFGAACGVAPTPAAPPETAPAEQSDTIAPTEPASIPIRDDVAYEITFANAYTWVNSIGTVWVQVIVEIENTGTVPLFLSSGAYDLEAADGRLVRSSTTFSAFPDVIAPGERGYFYEATILQDMDEAVELTVLQRPSIRRARVENIRLPITEFELTEDAFNIRMRGRIENTTEEDQTFIYVVAILFDDNDKPIGQLFTILMEVLSPGDRIGFEGVALSLPSSVTVDSISRYMLFAYPMQMQFG